MWKNNNLICDVCSDIIETRKDCPRINEQDFCDTCYDDKVSKHLEDLSHVYIEFNQEFNQTAKKSMDDLVDNFVEIFNQGE